MDELRPRYRWLPPPAVSLTPDLVAAGEAAGMSRRLVSILAARGHTDPRALRAFVAEPAAGLHDPRLLPDAAAFQTRVARAATNRERVLVFGDFDADGLTGLTILVLALRRLGLDVAPYVPDRTDEGHGLSLAAVERSASEGRTLVVTVDTGTSSVAEIQAAAARGIDVLVTDHHRVPPVLPPAVAIVNPQRADSAYPEKTSAGSGVAFKLAQLLLDPVDGSGAALDLVDLAAIGTIADVAPLTGENRAIVRLGLERLRSTPRPGLAALLARARLSGDRIDPEALAFGVVPRLNAAGRIGDAAVAAHLLLATDPAQADALAAELDSANVTRRELLAEALAEARAAAAGEPSAAATVVWGPWPVGIVGLVAGRLAEDLRRPAVVFSTTTDPWRGSARSAGRYDLAAGFAACADLFERFGGHAAAAGCHMPAANIHAFRDRLAALVGPWTPSEPELALDLVVGPFDVDYRLLRELAQLAPAGVGNPVPLVGVSDLGVVRVRPANGGHTQLTLRKGLEVLDAICFGRDDLPATVREGDTIDVVARLASRTFGGYESLQLEVRDAGPPGTLARLGGGERVAAA